MSYTGFKKLQGKLGQRPDVADPAALSAAIGRAKYGPKAMGKAAATSTPLKGHKPKKKSGRRAAIERQIRG